MFTPITELFHNRYLIWTFSAYDFRNQYLDSRFGFLWGLIKPLVLAGVYVLIFAGVVTPDANGSGTISHFGLYVFAGMLPWLVIQEAVQRGATVFLDNAHLVRHHKLPLYVLPLHLVISAAITGTLAILPFLAVQLFLSQPPGLVSLLVVFVLPLLVLFSWGLVMVVGTVTVFIRDIPHLTVVILTVWFFASPIVFPMENLPWFLTIAWLNPMIPFTAIYRDLLLFQQLPSGIMVALACLHAGLTFALGALLYQRTHREIVDWV